MKLIDLDKLNRAVDKFSEKVDSKYATKNELEAHKHDSEYLQLTDNYAGSSNPNGGATFVEMSDLYDRSIMQIVGVHYGVDGDNPLFYNSGVVIGSSGSITAEGGFNGNATSATKLRTARTFTIGNISKTFDGTENISYSLKDIGAAPETHEHTNLKFLDTRRENTSPLDVPAGLSVHLKVKDADGLGDGWAGYHTTLMIKGWNDKSGGPWGQMAITSNNNLWFRASVYESDTDWQSWRKVSTDDHEYHNRLSIPTTSGQWLRGKDITNAALEITTQQSGSDYHPLMAVKMNCGNVVNLGGINNDFGFYFYNATRTENGIDGQFSFDTYGNIINSTFQFTTTRGISADGDIYAKGQFLGESGLHTNGNLTTNAQLGVYGNAHFHSGVFFNDKVIGETLFSIDGTWADAWPGVGCAIKTYGGIATNSTFKSGYSHMYFGDIPLTISSYAPNIGGVWIQV